MSDATKLVWIQLACVGHFKGHSAGPFTLDAATFDDIVRNFNHDGLRVPIDAEHASEQDATSGSIPVTGAPAWGWIHSMENRGTRGLWGKVEWLEPARTYIKEGRYRYLSPAIRFNSRDRVTGEPIGARLTSAACTNSPFLSALQPLVAAKHGAGKLQATQLVLMSDEEVILFKKASRKGVGGEGGPPVAMAAAARGTYAYSAHEYMPMLRACLGASEDAAPQDLADRMKAMRAMHAMSGGAPMIASYVGSLRDNMRVPMTSTVEDIFDAVEAMISAAMQEHVDTMHPGQAAAATARMEDDEMAAMAAKTAAMAATQQELAMTEANSTPNEALVLKLSEATTKLTETDAKLATLTLQLGERDASITAKDVVITAKDAEIVTLKAEITKRDDADLDRQVQTAILYHGESQKLTGKEKMLRTVAKHDPDEFKRLYPLPVDKAGKLVPPYMLKSVPQPFGREVPTQTDAGADSLVDSATMPLDHLALKLIEESVGKDGKATLSLADAQNNALKLRNAGTR